MSDTHIGDHPPREFYGPDREVDCRCARCGSSCSWEDCSEGCDDGFVDRHDEDPLWYGHELYACETCDGRGGWNVCDSPADWCEANPLPGRADVARGTLEWFTVATR